MDLLIISFLAGIITVASPCVLPLIPIIVGGSITQKTLRRPFLIALGLGISIFLFSLLLKGTTSLIAVPTVIWAILSGVILIIFGIFLVWPSAWDKIAVTLHINSKSNKLLEKTKDGSSVLLGAALGPVFNSCSPTYALIVAVSLPTSFNKGMAYLFLYSLGLSLALLFIGLLGQKITLKTKWFLKYQKTVLKVVGVLFVLVGISLIMGFDKDIQAWIIKNGWYQPIGEFEESLNASNS